MSTVTSPICVLYTCFFKVSHNNSNLWSSFPVFHVPFTCFCFHVAFIRLSCRFHSAVILLPACIMFYLVSFCFHLPTCCLHYAFMLLVASILFSCAFIIMSLCFHSAFMWFHVTFICFHSAFMCFHLLSLQYACICFHVGFICKRMFKRVT